MNLSIQNRNNAHWNNECTGYNLTKRELVLDYIRRHGPITNRRLSEGLRLPINQITGRTREIVRLKLVRAVGTVFDEVTGRNVTQWAVEDGEQQMRMF